MERRQMGGKKDEKEEETWMNRDGERREMVEEEEEKSKGILGEEHVRERQRDEGWNKIEWEKRWLKNRHG